MEDFDRPYEILDGDLYHYDSSGHRQRVCHAGSSISVAYDRIDGVLHKHGEYNAVMAWYEETRATLMKHRSTVGLGEALSLATMPLDDRWVREMNRCIAVTGAVMGLEQRIRERYLETSYAAEAPVVPAPSPGC